jgi:hypothetical protein
MFGNLDLGVSLSASLVTLNLDQGKRLFLTSSQTSQMDGN